MMTRKDFQLIADALAVSRPNELWLNKHNQWTSTVNNMTTALASSNPRFNPSKFKAACNERNPNHVL